MPADPPEHQKCDGCRHFVPPRDMFVPACLWDTSSHLIAEWRRNPRERVAGCWTAQENADD